MKTRSPHTILYSDLVVLAEEVFSQKESHYKGAVGRGVGNLDYFVHKMQTAKLLVRMLKKGLPGKQLDMYELFKEVSK